MVTFIQFRQELIFTSGGPRCAIEKKKKREKENYGKKLQYVLLFSISSISVTDI